MRGDERSQEEVIEEFARYVSPSRVATHRQMGFAMVPGPSRRRTRLGRGRVDGGGLMEPRIRYAQASDEDRASVSRRSR